MDQSEKISSGVDELIARLREEGVEAGRTEAAQLLAGAREEADRVKAAARAEAEARLAEVSTQIETERRAAEEALRLASRDTLLDVASQLSTAFAGRLRRMIAEELQKDDLLQRLILAVAGRARDTLPEDEPFELLVTKSGPGRRKGRGKSDGPADESLHAIVVDIASDLLREGVDIKTGEGDESGIRIRLQNEDVVVDLQEESLAELLISHLAPRFRAMLRGTET